MAKKKKMDMSCTCCSHGSGFYMFKGIVSILLGLILWFGYLNMSQTIAIVLVLLGIKKLFYSTSCCKK